MGVVWLVGFEIENYLIDVVDLEWWDLKWWGLGETKGLWDVMVEIDFREDRYKR